MVGADQQTALCSRTAQQTGRARETGALASPERVALHYDRGTICIEGPREKLAGMQLPGALWDARVGIFRAPGYRYPEVARALAMAGVSARDRVQLPTASPLDVQAPQLRPYQTDSLMAWSLAGRRGIVVLPTGSGKTHVALAALAMLQQPTLVLVPTRVLLEQWVTRIAGVYQGAIGVQGDGQRSLGPITLATFESAYRHMDLFGNRFGLLVVDEVHHFSGGLRTEALELCTAGARLGLTATPPAQPEALMRLALLVGPVVSRYSIGGLCGKHLAPFDQIRLYLDLSPEERVEYALNRRTFAEAYRSFRRAGGTCWAHFVQAAGQSAAGRAALGGFFAARRIVACAQAKLELVGKLLLQHAQDRVLIFTADNAGAYALSRRYLIPAITCDIGRKERQAILGWLAAGRVRAVVSSRVLNEGIDLPEARVGIIVGGTLGGREHVQRVGRLLRPQEGKRALVYELVARDTAEEGHAQRRQLALMV